jgi:hypothetical protein
MAVTLNITSWCTHFDQIAYRTGQAVGQPIGGLLSHPERHIPLPIFKAPFWEKYPFSLPCFVAAGLVLSSVAIGWAVMQEVGELSKISREVIRH